MLKAEMGKGETTTEEKDVFWGRCDPATLAGGPFKYLPPAWTETGQCSHCGGERPSKVLALLREPKATVEPTDKNYKIYVRGLGRS